MDNKVEPIAHWAVVMAHMSDEEVACYLAVHPDEYDEVVTHWKLIATMLEKARAIRDARDKGLSMGGV